MTLTWTVCGAGSGVGKTHLARKLCEVLPNSVYAKSGCGRRKPDKPANFFANEAELAAFIDASRDTYEHIVAESNARARKGLDDVIIYIDGIPGRTHYRADVDVLRCKAHLHISPEASIRDWKNLLRGRLTPGALCEEVCDVLVEHKRYLSRSGPTVRTKVWFAVDGMHAFGSGLAALLADVDRCGTLQQAARDNGMSYRHAWGLVKNAEKHLGKPLILSHTGGVGGGRTYLSKYGRRLLDTYNRLNEEVSAFANERFADPLKEGARVGAGLEP